MLVDDWKGAAGRAFTAIAGSKYLIELEEAEDKQCDERNAEGVNIPTGTGYILVHAGSFEIRPSKLHESKFIQ